MMGILGILLKIVMVAPSLGTAYQTIVDSLHRTGELTDAEWEAKKGEYTLAMGGDAWKID